MASVAEKLLSAEEFGDLPDPNDGARQVLVRGVVITMPPPKGLHGACCARLSTRIGLFVEKHKIGHVFSNDTGIITERDPDTVRGVDLAFWSFEKLPKIPDDYIDIPPDLAIEVLSPKNSLGTVEGKLREFFKMGVPLVWVVDPKKRLVNVYRSLKTVEVLHELDVLQGEEALPGFTCKVSELFP